jgi:NADH-quinone oxidoreductase subunit J
VAALEVIIYAGAIMVLFIFVMMMLNLGQRSAEQEKRWLSPGVYIGPAFLSLILAACFVYMLTQGEATPAGYEAISPQQLGLSMFSTYLLGVELAGMLLLAALVGAYHLARSDQHEDPPSVKRTARKHEEAGSLE